jgi:type IV secretory pathway TrbL component
MKKYLTLTLVISILAGIILSLALGVKDLTLIAISFCSVWFVYAVILLIVTLLVKPGLKIKGYNRNGAKVVTYELNNSTRNK